MVEGERERKKRRSFSFSVSSVYPVCQIKSKIRKERVIKNAHGGYYVFCVTSTKDYVITGGWGNKAILWEKGGKGQKVRTLKG